MGLKGAVVAIAGLVALAGAAAAQDAKDDDELLKYLKPAGVIRFVASNEKTKIEGTFSLTLNCAVAGKIAVRVMKKPQHGDVSIVEDEGYSTYSPRDKRSKCNSVLSPITSIYYTSHPDYVGEDGMRLLFLYQGTGAANLRDVTILVR